MSFIIRKIHVVKYKTRDEAELIAQGYSGGLNAWRVVELKKKAKPAKLAENSLPHFDFGDGPVPAHRHINGGGWVADTAYVAPTAYVGPKAKVFGHARVYGNASVCGHTRIFGNTEVFGRPWIYYGDSNGTT